ncbi:hypothetical protein C2I36_07510 [Rhodobacteraceae bacterium WD3A24]|nr:hypothetical protein C2I36_07510 [Rhodobacteraceae bacterium WD3A24]
MSASARPLYLARESYRRRRLMDAARLLPIAGAVLLALPLLWAPEPAPERATAHDTVYLFGVWLALILAAAALARRLAPAMEEDRGAGGAG